MSRRVDVIDADIDDRRRLAETSRTTEADAANHGVSSPSSLHFEVLIALGGLSLKYSEAESISQIRCRKQGLSPHCPYSKPHLCRLPILETHSA